MSFGSAPQISNLIPHTSQNPNSVEYTVLHCGHRCASTTNGAGSKLSSGSSAPQLGQNFANSGQEAPHEHTLDQGEF